jgi:hypothetical protein
MKMIRRGHYSSNNFQDSNKRKGTKNKTLGYLPRVLFFNAFELLPYLKLFSTISRA